MKIVITIISMVFGLVLFSCQSENRGGGQIIVTSEGHNLNFHKRSKKIKHPKPGDFVYFHVIQIIKDTVITDSHNGVYIPKIMMPEKGEEEADVKPIVEALREMSVGDSATLTMPFSDVEDLQRVFQSFDYIDFTITLRAIRNEEEYKADVFAERSAYEKKLVAIQDREVEVSKIAQNMAPKLTSGELDGDVQVKEAVKWFVHEEGTGPYPEAGSVLWVHFVSAFSDGQIFDNSFKSGLPYKFILGKEKVIKGWDIAFPNIREGSKVSMFVPYYNAYGKAGSPPLIPESMDLVFYIEFEKIVL
jgi:FKBP-type peptidyl-prolyl cis-trans isomerase